MPFIKAHQKIGGRAKGALNKDTLTKLERRAYFDRRAQEKFDEWIEKIRPEYGLDQFLGKVSDKLSITSSGKPVEPSPKIKELADKLTALERGYWNGKRIPENW
jgi:hypothetical protein